MLYLSVFFTLLLLYTVLFCIDIKAALDYVRNEEYEWVLLSFYTIDGFFRYSYVIPVKNTSGERIRFKLIKGKRNDICKKIGKKERLTPIDIVNKYISVRTYLKDHSGMFEDIRYYLNRKDIHVELNVKITQGTGDAAQTGLLCGLLWSAGGILITHLSRFLKAFKKDINIVPVFDKRIFEVDANCIFHVKLVHIIVVLIKIRRAKHLIRIKTKKTTGGEVSG